MQSPKNASDFIRLWMKESYLGNGTEGNHLFPNHEKTKPATTPPVKSIVEGVFSVWEKNTPNNQHKTICEVEVLLEEGEARVVAVRAKGSTEEISDRVFIPRSFLEALPKKVKQSLPLLGVKKRTLFG